MAKQQVTVPDIGGAEGAEVIEILVAVGESVSLDQSLIVLESDKASMEIPSSSGGVVAEILVTIGQELSEGAPIVVLDVEGETAAAQPEPAAGETKAVAASPAPAEVSPPTVKESADGDIVVDRMVCVPDIGTDEPVEVIELSVGVGDNVLEGDSLLVLESDKASMEVPAPFSGVVLRILVGEGDSVREGHEILVLGAVAPDNAAPAARVPSPQAKTAKRPTPAVASDPAISKPSSTAPAPDKGASYAGPAVRKLAREFGIDIQAVQASGPRGRLLKEDLHAYAKKALSGGAPAATAGVGIPAVPEIDFSRFGEIEVVARSKMDKVTAANLQRSWLNVPHVTQFDDADITDMEAFRGSMKSEAEKRGARLTPMPFLLKACAVALRDNPKFRSSLTDHGENLAYKQYTHIGMAVDTPAGLVVPVLRDVDKKTLWELADEVIDLATRARDRKLKPAQMQGGCFTISSLGGIGGQGFTPIVNAPEVGILGVSRAATKPVWNGSEFAPRKMLPLSLSYDHRVINGGDAGRFLTQLVELLSDIRKLML